MHHGKGADLDLDDLCLRLLQSLPSSRTHVRDVGVHRPLPADGALEAAVAPSEAVLFDENVDALETETVAAL